jgi:hypothetical protein
MVVGLIGFPFSNDFLTEHFKKNEISLNVSVRSTAGLLLAVDAYALAPPLLRS